MAWIGALAGKAETLLNKVDQAAGQVLHKEDGDDSDTAPVASQWQPPQNILETPTDYSPFLGEQKTLPAKVRSNNSGPSQPDVVTDTAASSSSLVKKSTSLKEMDQELFEFLNKSSGVETVKRDSPSRPSSTSSTVSTRSGKTPEHVAESDILRTYFV